MTPIGMTIAALAGAVVLTDDLRRLHERLIRDAIGLSRQTMQQAALEADIDQAQLTKQIQLTEGSHKRLAMQPRAFWQWYGLAIIREFGLPDEVALGARAGRMAKMALPSERKQTA